jgi:hypothetical protein
MQTCRGDQGKGVSGACGKLIASHKNHAALPTAMGRIARSEWLCRVLDYAVSRSRVPYEHSTNDVAVSGRPLRALAGPTQLS